MITETQLFKSAIDHLNHLEKSIASHAHVLEQPITGSHTLSGR
jgi:hypothetical protein